MKRLLVRIIALIFFMPTIVLAGWQVATPYAAAPNNPYFQAGMPSKKGYISSYRNNAFPSRYAMLGGPASVYAISVSGSLKENIERIMDRYHWHVIWKVGYDYNFDGRITGSSLPDVIKKLLKPFPLQAVMYMSNCTLVVIPRKV